MAAGDVDFLTEQFPDNVSISELCDCGKHKRRKQNVPIPRKSCPFPESDYARTFKAVEHPRPRSSKRPPPSPTVRDRHSAPMMFSTNQRDDFKSPGAVSRTKPIIPEENYEPLNVPIEKMTSYNQEFTAKQAQPEFRRMETRGTVQIPDVKFDGHTTNKDHFKQWIAQPTMHFQELPSFTGSILFPGKNKLPSSETKQQFRGEFIRRPEAVRLADANITMEGDMQMTTTNNDTYKMIYGDHRAERIVKKPTLGTSKKLGKFETETQNRRDFPQYAGARPAKLAEPAPETIDLRFDNKRSFQTEQRSIYKGHDIRQNPMQKPIRHDIEEFNPPSVKFETETSNKRDFQPIDIAANLTYKAQVPHSTIRVPDVKFDGRTSFGEFFKNYGAIKRERYGDFHENRPYIPPQTKFDGVSTTKTTFTPKKWEPTRPFLPENRPIESDGAMDFSTVHNETYQKPKVKPCRAEIYLIQKELRRQKELEAARIVAAK